MPKSRVLLQVDTDPHPSVFDSVVALDAGVDHLLRHGGVDPEGVRSLVHGCIFTRGPDELKNTAIFIGGSDVARGEELLRQIQAAFFGPLRVSVLLDSNGANTTAAAAVLAASKHLELAGGDALVLGGTGPVGQRIARLLAGAGANVRVGSRQPERAQSVVDELLARHPSGNLSAVATGNRQDLADALSGVQVVFAAGAAGVTLLPSDIRKGAGGALHVAIDLNAVPPLGIEGIDVMDRGAEREGAKCYGAIGVGGAKMKIHKAAIRRLFEAHDLVLDAEEIYKLATSSGA